MALLALANFLQACLKRKFFYLYYFPNSVHISVFRPTHGAARIYISYHLMPRPGIELTQQQRCTFFRRDVLPTELPRPQVLKAEVTHREKSFPAAVCPFRDHHSISSTDSGQFFGSVSIELEKLTVSDFPLKSETLARRIRTTCPTDSFPKVSAF